MVGLGAPLGSFFVKMLIGWESKGQVNVYNGTITEEYKKEHPM